MVNKSLKKSKGGTLERLLSSLPKKTEEIGEIENYSIIVYGESHISEKDQQREIEIIRKFKPDYILEEGGSSIISLKNEDYYGVTMNLEKDFLNKISDKNLRSKTENELNEIYSSMKANPRKNKYMEDLTTFNDVMKRSLVGLPVNYLEEVEKIFHGYINSQNRVENFKRNDVIFNNFQRALTNLVAYKKDVLDSKQPNKLILHLTAYNANNNVKVIEMDLPALEIEGYYYRKKPYQRDNDLNKKREERMARNIASYANTVKNSGERIFVKVGDYHLRKDSAISRYLDGSELPYKIFRSIGDDALFIDKIRYSIRLHRKIREDMKNLYG